MLLSGVLTTMNIWVDKVDDIRLSVNDGYMILLMTGWMFLFMGVVYKDITPFVVGSFLVIANIWCIRTQFMVTNTQYMMGMIPHHSMAIHMSKQLIQNQPATIVEFATNVIRAQESEIKYLKNVLRSSN
jgi:hypothetical protein